MPDKTFDLSIKPGNRPGVSIITVSGALVLEHLFRFQDAWRGQADASALVFDLAGVAYMDSSAIGSLVNAHVSRTRNGKTMALAGVQAQIRQILTVTHVDSLFQFYPDVEQAELGVHANGVHA